eukprot:TRINITY_DN2791_c0_g1_i1.p3 TRINITY_DN2791_c0_g1~~TRINITY_DN2791_c0_g1_i1.p3  ORF type:complete len:102 (+),score=22.10 TRINITY_DN2791_c0_g1_i1:223-528(+)
MKRVKTLNDYEFEEDSYPHKFFLYDHNNQLAMKAFQSEIHGPIFFFTKDEQQFYQYSQNYIGCVERNFWGMKFEIYDWGIDEKVLKKFLNIQLKLDKFMVQ